MPKKSPAWKERTVAFFEIVAVTPAGRQRMAHQPWPEFLAALAGASVDDRSWDGGDRRIFGSAYPLEEVDRLTLHRVRDPADWLQKVSFASGTIEDLEAAAGEGFVDTTAVHFAEFGNVVGIIQGGLSAPGHSVLENWLHEMDPFGVELGVVPLQTKAEQERLHTAALASSFELHLGASARNTLDANVEAAEEASSFAQWLRGAPVDPELSLHVRVSTPRGKNANESRFRLRNQIEELFPVLPEEASKAQATLFHGFEDDKMGPARLTELVEHAVTMKRRVPAVNEHGESIRVQAAFQVIESVIVEHEDELRRAVED